jgi:hypothetical protein
LTKRESSSAYNIEIGEHVEGMIRHLCNRIPDREWSGVLFYTVDGSFENGLIVHCKDICLMDIGSSTYTEFDTSPDIAGYMVEHDLLDCHLGLVHSHNTMATFFSGTDTSTLQEEGSYKNNFVSLIVNNKGTYTAAITRHVFSEVKGNSSFTYEMFGNGPVTSNEDVIEKKECIEYFMMNVVKPNANVEQNPLDIRINEILDKKHKATNKVRVIGNQNVARYNDRSSYDTARSTWLWEDETEDKSAFGQKDAWRQMDIPWDEREFAKPKNISNTTVNKDALKVTLAKILTGSVTCNPYNIDVDSWIANYDKVYESKFKDLVEFSDWLAPYLEYVMYHIPGLDDVIIDNAAVACYADAIIDKIGKPKGKFSKELIDQLKFYGTE